MKTFALIKQLQNCVLGILLVVHPLTLPSAAGPGDGATNPSLTFVTLGGGPGGSSGNGPPSPPDLDQALPANDMARLRDLEPFKSLPNDAARMAKLRMLRESVIYAITWTRSENPALADCLQRMFDTNRIVLVFGFGPNVGGNLVDDSSTGCDGDRLNLPILSVPCPKPPAYSPGMWGFINTLLHEGLHATQAMPIHPNPRPPAGSVARVQHFKTMQALEIEASRAELSRLCALLAFLRMIEDGATALPESPPGLENPPPGAVALARAIAESILADATLTPQMRKDKARDLRTGADGQRGVEQLKRSAALVLACRIHLEQQLCLFLNGVIDWQTALRNIQQLAWWTDAQIKTYIFGVYQIQYACGGGTLNESVDPPLTTPDFHFHQLGGGRDESFFLSGLDQVYGGMLVNNGAGVLVAGGERATGDGVIVAFSDTDNDGFFEPNTRVEILRSLDFSGGNFLAADPTSGRVLVFNRRQNAIFELTRSGNPPHQFPNAFHFRGTFGEQNPDVLSIIVAPDGLTVYGTQELDPIRSLPLAQGEAYPVAKAMAAGGEFVPQVVPFEVYKLTPVIPLFRRVPVAGDASVLANGSVGMPLELYLVEGNDRVLLSTAAAGTDRTAMISLGDPLVAGVSLIIRDSLSGRESSRQSVWDPPVLRMADVSFAASWPSNVREMRVTMHGRPGAPVYLQESTDLIEWKSVAVLTLDGYGFACFALPVAGQTQAKLLRANLDSAP